MLVIITSSLVSHYNYEYALTEKINNNTRLADYL